jgi:hypothetical protein
MGGAPFTNRVPKRTTKIITFDGVSYGVTTSPTTIFSISGMVWLQCIAVRAIVSLVGASATIALGFASNTGGLIAATTAANITTGLIWAGTSPATGGAAALVNYTIDSAIIATIATANITAGQLQFETYWLPMGTGGQLY